MQAMITGVGHFTPENKLTNHDLEQMVDTNDEWITTRTGIRERRILDKEKGTAYMAVKAAESVLEQTRTKADEIDLILVATVTPDRPVPATAALVQKGLSAVNAWGFDINGGCTGFICALATGSQFVKAGSHQKVLVIGADKMSSIINYKDRTTCVLFGDAAGAVLLEPSNDEEFGIRDFILHLDGSGADYLNIPAGGSLCPASHETVDQHMHYVYQDGKKVFKHAVTAMAEVSAEIMARNNLTDKEIKCLIPHQANLRIIDAAAKRMGLHPDQVIININKYGNTTAATIPLAMSEAYSENRLKKGDWAVMSAFGAGFTWGSLLFRWAIV
ncbi:MAG: ketoacyl-ACP synthase III [Desulfobacterales bacterium]|nr:MAG: ketoacyl-ACP synthase III [Desulfobacterales bacterium]